MAGTANIPGGMFPAPNGFSRLVGPIVLWDMSCADNETGGVRRNNRHQKLGHRAGARGGAVGLYGESTTRAFLIDGNQAVEAGEVMSTILPFEPDNWTPRYHDFEPGKGTGRDSVWALRLIAEHQTKSDKAAHRSTMVIDNAQTEDGERQDWGFLSDVIWVTGRQSDIEGEALAYTDAGFLSMITSYVNDQDTAQGDDRRKNGFVLGHLHRVALAYSICKNGGFVTDGSKVAQWNHLFCFAKPAASATGQTRPDQEDELVIRGDAKFKFGQSKIGRLQLKDFKPDEDDGDPKLVHFPILLKKAPNDDKLDNGQDTNSNHKNIPKDANCQDMYGAVLIKKPGTCEPHHYDHSYHHPPPGSSSSSSSSGTPTSGASGAGTSGGGGSGSGTGSKPPTGGTSGPKGPGVPTVDDAYQHPDGTPIGPSEASDTYDNPSMQAQHGWAPPRSPGYQMRGNIYPNDKGENWNPVGSLVATKAKGYTGIDILLVCAFSADIPASEIIELNVIVQPHEDGAGPSTSYRQAFLFTDAYEADPTEYKLRIKFRGFAKEEELFTVLLERRNDTNQGTNAMAELCILRASVISQK